MVDQQISPKAYLWMFLGIFEQVDYLELLLKHIGHKLTFLDKFRLRYFQTLRFHLPYFVQAENVDARLCT